MGFFDALVSKNRRNLYGNFYLQLCCVSMIFIVQKQGNGVLVLVYLHLLLHSASFSHHFICLFAPNCLQISSFTVLVEGILSYNPPVRKSVFPVLRPFLTEPPLVATLLPGQPGHHPTRTPPPPTSLLLLTASPPSESLDLAEQVNEITNTSWHLKRNPTGSD